MCTAIAYRGRDHYFGRNLDLEYSYQETITVMPRNYPLSFRCTGTMKNHYAMIGTAYVQEGYPLYYDATNEKGLSMAGLNFVGYAVYHAQREGRDNITPYELIAWILGQCADLAQARVLLQRLNLVDIPFNNTLPTAQLHWMVSDRTGSLVVESTCEGLQIHENPVGVLTNNPTFDVQMLRLSDYMGLSSLPPVNRLCPDTELAFYSRGMGAMGLPGDLSSTSRFVRGAFYLLNSPAMETEEESVSQFFHILAGVAHIRGSVKLEDGQDVITVYTSCCNTDRGVYYYTTCESSQLTGVDMRRENLDGKKLISYPMLQNCQIRMQN